MWIILILFLIIIHRERNAKIQEITVLRSGGAQSRNDEEMSLKQFEQRFYRS